MEKLVLNDIQSFELVEGEITPAQLDEVVIKVKNCGICGTDIHIFHGDPGSAEVTPPITLGHELAGEVISVGAEVTSLVAGDRVAVDPNIYCGKCRFCREGRIHLCDSLSAIGVTRDGGMAEYCTVPEKQCFKLPDSIDYEQGAMVEPISCVLHGIHQLDFACARQILVMGGGFIGSIFVQIVKNLSTADITVCEIDSSKYANLKNLGADKVVASLDDCEADFDIIIECIGRVNTIENSINYANKGAQVLLFGVSSPSDMITISPYAIFSKELVIKGSFINPNTLEEAIRYLETGKIDIKSLLSHRIKLAQVPDLIKNYSELKVTKAMIELGR